jgi:hypothetical protein
VSEFGASVQAALQVIADASPETRVLGLAALAAAVWPYAQKALTAG